MDSMPTRGNSFVSWRLPLLTVLFSWLCFCVAAAAWYGVAGRQWQTAGFIIVGVGPLGLAKLAADSRRRWWPWLQRRLADHTARVDALADRRLRLWIALAAGVGLYFELVLIRYHGTCFAIFDFFKNVSLLSCFLGLGIGYALGTTRLLLTPLVLPMLAVQLITMHLLRYADVAPVMQSPIAEQWTMGMENASGVVRIVIVYSFLIWTFSFNALCLIPLGQLASRLMGRGPKLVTYGWNLLGSIAAVLVFWGLSFLWAPPVVWVGVGIIALIPFLRGVVSSTAIISAAVLALLGTSLQVDSYDVYSPYQILTVLSSGRMSVLLVNHFFFQTILDLSPQGPDNNGRREIAAEYYGLAYAIRPSPNNVLIVGSGAGNDVASAVRHGAGHVDAVEIDPAVLRLGQSLHPEQPYESDHVSAHVQDARAFIRFTRQQYDLLVYGLLDSHTSLSGLSGVRLDSYIYTVQAFKEARAHLTDNGVLCVSFALIHEELGRKLYLMLQEAFDGLQPHVYLAQYDGAAIFVIGKNSAVGAANLPATVKDVTNQYGVDNGGIVPSTDDWPFFYMPVRKYPVSYLVMIAMLLATALVFIRPVVQMGGGRAGISGPCFLLGAGFMLLETKAVTELALFYGSTWIVVSIVILAILLMALAANFLVIRWPRIPLPLAYVLLLASLAASLWFSTFNESMQSEWLSRILATAVITLPLFFSGLIFSAEMDASKSVAVALGSNLIGAMLGGCLEYNSMYFGYRSLYILAIGIYGLCMVVSLARRVTRDANGLREHDNQLEGQASSG
jgi:spermidine synthase